MNLKDVMEEIADKLKLFTGHNVFSYPVDSITPPGGVIGYPESITYDETYQQGEMMFNNLPVWLVTGRTDSESARNQASEWTDPQGGNSVKKFLDTTSYSSCDDVQVGTATFDTFSVGAIEYLVVIFDVTVTGEG
jgi:hypothetical protein